MFQYAILQEKCRIISIHIKCGEVMNVHAKYKRNAGFRILVTNLYSKAVRIQNTGGKAYQQLESYKVTFTLRADSTYTTFRRDEGIRRDCLCK